MGHGASTNVKKVSLVKEVDNQDQRPGWTRSNSDGCIVENLNTSKTKVDLLEQLLSEYKELLQAAEAKNEEADQKAKLLEKQMAEVEGANFELTDRVSELEQQLESLQPESTSEVNNRLEQELLLSNQQVEKLEMHVKVLEDQMTSMRSKFRKKLRVSKTEVTEAKQESALKIYSLKDEIKQLEEENLKLTERVERLSSSSQGTDAISAKVEKDQGVGEDSKTMVILELSSQVSTQEDRIMELEGLLKQKDDLISNLSNRTSQQKPLSRPPSGNSVRCSSAGSRSGSHKSVKAQRHVESANHEDDFQDSDDGDDFFGSSSVNKNVYSTENENDRRKGSAKSVSLDSDEHVSQKRQRKSSRDRRHSGSLKDGKMVKDVELERDDTSPKSTDSKKDRETKNRKDKRNRSSSRDGGMKAEVHRQNLESKDHYHHHHHHGTPADAVSVEPDERRRGSVKSRGSSARSEDSALHHYDHHDQMEEGTKSAPSSAGSSRLRRRLKVTQQRAASIDRLTNSDENSHRDSPQTLPVGGKESQSSSGTGGDLAKVSSTLTHPTDNDLDELLHELMSDSPVDVMHKDTGKHGGHRSSFGISEDKIRSLMSDHNENDVTST